MYPSSSCFAVILALDYRTLTNIINLNKTLLLSSYSNTSASSLEVDNIVSSILGYKPFNKSNSLSCFKEVNS